MKRRTTISIESAAHNLGKALAKQDHRDFSNEIEWLIENETKRRDASKSQGAQLPVANHHQEQAA